MNMMPGWYRTAERLDNDICLDAFEKANRLPNGRLRKRHVPYSVPEYRQALRDAYQSMDELETKRIMMLIRSGCVSLI